MWRNSCCRLGSFFEYARFFLRITNQVYFRTLRITIVAGRPFEDRDDERSAPLVIVNANLAERFWGSPASPLGSRRRVADGEWRTVVGVAADVKYSKITDPPRPYFYLPFLQ